MDIPKGYNFSTSSHQIINTPNLKIFRLKYRNNKTFPIQVNVLILDYIKTKNN